MLATTEPCSLRFVFAHGYLALALLLIAPPAGAIDAAALGSASTEAMAQAASPQAIAEYRLKLREYQEARAAFDEEAGAWYLPPFLRLRAEPEPRQPEGARRDEEDHGVLAPAWSCRFSDGRGSIRD